MARFFIDLDGEARDEIGYVFDTPDQARNAAIARLGAYLQEHPAFAYEGHWRVDVRDHAKRILLHVIVATVDAPKPIHFASYDNDAAQNSSTREETFQRSMPPSAA